MRFGICVGTKQIKFLKRLGCDYAEISLSGIHALTDEEFDALLKECDDCDIRIEATNGFFPSHIGLVRPGFNSKIITEYTNKALKRASKLGAKVCVLGSGRNRKYEGNCTHEEALEDFRRVLSITGEIGQKYGITVAVEPLSYAETNLINTVREAYDVVRDLNIDNVRLMADFYHMRNNNEDFGVLREVGDYLMHVHISCYTAARRFPMSAKEDRYREFFDVLREIGYDRTVSIEAGVSDLMAEGQVAIPLLKEL